MRYVPALILMAFSCAARADIVRFVSDEKGFAVNSWLIPTTHGLVVVDTQFTVPEAEKLSQAIAKTGRPLMAIIVTHPHPDHFNGVCRLLEVARVPVYATRATIDGIHATAAAKRAQWKPVYGADYPDHTCEPDTVVPGSGGVRIDGTAFQFQDLGPGEASAESVIIVASLKAAFVGDLIYQGMHPWLAEGRSGLWLNQLDGLEKSLPKGITVYPGHGASDGAGAIGAQRQYIDAFRGAIKASLTPTGLPPESSRIVAATTRAQHSGWPLEMLIPMNIAAVADELGYFEASPR
jgi:glyoxylase-like metal-dependent hydrolase (beta-lactamase superfamily II)